MLKCSSERWVCASPQLVGWDANFAEAVPFPPGGPCIWTEGCIGDAKASPPGDAHTTR